MKLLVLLTLVLLFNLGENQCFAYECDSGWHLMGNKCIYVFYSNYFHSAVEQRCYTLGADMVSIHSLDDLLFLSKLTLTNSFWTGGKRNSTDKKTFFWTDGSEWNYVRWAVNEPNCNSNYDCVRIYNGFLYTYPCNNNYYQMCQKPAVVSRHVVVDLNFNDTLNRMNQVLNSVNVVEERYNESVARMNATLENDLQPIAEKVYNFENHNKQFEANTTKKFSSISELLKSYGTKLTSLEKHVTQSEAHNSEKEHEENETATKVKKIEDKIKKLVQASDMISNVLTIHDETIAFDPHGGRSEKLIEQNEIDTKPPEVSSLRCVNTNGVTNCYYFVKNAINFGEAKKQCKALNSNVASITTKEDNQFLLGYMILNEHYWIGGLRVTPYSNNFAWIDGAVFNYTNFEDPISAKVDDKRFGDNSRNKSMAEHPQVKNCLSVKHGVWYQDECNKKYSVICKATDMSKKRKPDGNTIIDIHTNDLFEFDARIKNLEKSIAIIVDALTNDTHVG